MLFKVAKFQASLFAGQTANLKEKTCWHFPCLHFYEHFSAGNRDKLKKAQSVIFGITSPWGWSVNKPGMESMS